MFLLRENDISWTPAVDIYESDSKWLVFLELPGGASEAIDITVFPESILISGIKPPAAKALSAEKIEIYTGYFRREIKLPERISIAESSATLRNGVLSLVLPVERPASIRIPISKPGEPIEIEEGD